MSAIGLLLVLAVRRHAGRRALAGLGRATGAGIVAAVAAALAGWAVVAGIGHAVGPTPVAAASCRACWAARGGVVFVAVAYPLDRARRASRWSARRADAVGEEGRTRAVTTWRGSVALVLASSTGGIGQHVASLARGLSAAGCRVLVCGPAATDELFGFTAAGAAFAPVEIPANPARRTPARSAAAPRAVAGRDSTSCTRTGCAPRLVAGLARPAPAVVTWHNAVLAKGLRGQASRWSSGSSRAARAHPGRLRGPGRPGAALGARDARLGPVAAPRCRRPSAPGPRSAPSSGSRRRPADPLGRPAAPAEALRPADRRGRPGGAT
jgi:hypothetical protein